MRWRCGKEGEAYEHLRVSSAPPTTASTAEPVREAHDVAAAPQEKPGLLSRIWSGIKSAAKAFVNFFADPWVMMFGDEGNEASKKASQDAFDRAMPPSPSLWEIPDKRRVSGQSSSVASEGAVSSGKMFFQQAFRYTEPKDRYLAFTNEYGESEYGEPLDTEERVSPTPPM